MKVIIVLLLTSLLVRVYGQGQFGLMFPESEAEIQRWLHLGKPKGFEEILREEPLRKPPFAIRINQVVTSTLESQWTIQIDESGVERQEGLTQASRGPFDVKFGSGYAHKWLQDTQTFGFKSGRNGNFDSAELFLEKLTRIGTRFALSGAVEREFNPSFVFGNPYNRTNQTRVTFLVDQPLLRRLIYNEEAVAEKVNELELMALRNDLTQTMAENVRAGLLIYWDLVAAQRIVTINENAKKIFEALASATENLVEGERVARSELNEQFAELARSNREVIQSKQDLFRLYNDLLFQMGVSREEFSVEVPNLILDDFPLFDLKKSDWDLSCLLDIALGDRGDLIAAQYRISESQLLNRLAKQEIYPDLDVSFGYDLFNTQINRRARPFFSSAETHKAQNDYTVAVNFSVPIPNNRARGERRRREQEEIQAYLVENRLSEEIKQQIATAYRQQLELIDQIEYAHKTVVWYQKALRDEILRFKEGYGSLFIIVDFENRLRLTLIREAEILALWSKNIVELLFLTGTLIERDVCTDEMCVDFFNFKKLLLKDECR